MTKRKMRKNKKNKIIERDIFHMVQRLLNERSEVRWDQNLVDNMDNSIAGKNVERVNIGIVHFGPPVPPIHSPPPEEIHAHVLVSECRLGSLLHSEGDDVFFYDMILQHLFELVL
mmetsp:Transcript_41796/g.81932  ORF Transcript_41796/g.81932 Transcript_41796/m.81932 type:complete len:115 (-) Transcript_41796:342-686(-)